MPSNPTPPTGVSTLAEDPILFKSLLTPFQILLLSTIIEHGETSDRPNPICAGKLSALLDHKRNRTTHPAVVTTAMNVLRTLGYLSTPIYPPARKVAGKKGRQPAYYTTTPRGHQALREAVDVHLAILTAADAVLRRRGL
jgi:hypothetical protein